MKGAGINPEEKPVTGQDSTVAGLQRILKGEQFMTIFKPIEPEAKIAAEMAISLGETGEEVPKEPKESTPKKIENGKTEVPSILLTSTPVIKENINETVIAEKFVDPGGTVRRRLRGGLQRSRDLGLSMSPDAPLLQLEGISKHFGPVHALDRVDFAVSAGEVVGLVGDNGAGKSTLVKTIAGINGPDSGKIRFEGKEVSINRPQDATSLGIATVYQDLALCDNLDVVANLFLGSEEHAPGVGRGHAGSSTRSTMEHRAADLLSNLAVTIPSLRSEVGTLSGGQRQQVAVARSLLGEPKVVMLDEPTAALGVPQTKQVLALIKRLRERDLGVVVISHNLADVFEVADRIFVLRLGRPSGDFSSTEVTEEHVVAAITGLGNNAGARAEVAEDKAEAADGGTEGEKA